MYTMVSSFFVEGKFSWLFQMLIQVIDDVVLLRTRISTLCAKDTLSMTNPPDMMSSVQRDLGDIA